MSGTDRHERPGAWQRLLLPERPGLPQFLLGLCALLLPLVGLHDRHGIDPLALVLSVSLGCALGASWLVLLGRTWMRLAPVNAVCVYAMCFASLVHLDVMPRWDALVRAQSAMDLLQAYVADRAAGHAVELRPYDTGNGQARFTVRTDAAGRPTLLYTPPSDPIMRWTPIGWRPGCFVVVKSDGSGQVLRNAEALDAALAAVPQVFPEGISEPAPAAATAALPATAATTASAPAPVNVGPGVPAR